MPRRVRALVAFAVVSLTVGLLVPVPASAQARADSPYTAFEVPGKVQCQITRDDGSGYGNTVRCDVQGATFQAPPRPENCYADWGATVGMDSMSKAPTFRCVGEAISLGGALAPGASITEGAITCTGLVDGVECREPDGFGFSVTPAAWTWLRPASKELLKPGSIGGVKVGMTLKRVTRMKAVRRVSRGCSGVARIQLRNKYQGAYIVWHKKRVGSLVAWSKSTVATTKGVGVGSSLADAQAAYPDARLQSVSWPYNARALVHRRGKSRLWMFFEPGYDEPPVWAGTRMSLMVSSRSWRPRKQLDYHGCGEGF